MAETLQDIVADLRAQNQGLSEDAEATSPLACDMLRLADRIEAALIVPRVRCSSADAVAEAVREMLDYAKAQEAEKSYYCRELTTCALRAWANTIGYHNAKRTMDEPPGDVASMRAALKGILDSASDEGYNLAYICEEANSALRMTPRNCDCHDTAEEAWNAYVEEKGPASDRSWKSLILFSKWLFSPAGGGQP